MDGKLDETLAETIWGGGLSSGRKKEKQFARMMCYQMEKSDREGWPASELMMKYGVEIEREDGCAMSSTKKRLESICKESPSGRVRVILDAKRRGNYEGEFWALTEAKPSPWGEVRMGTRLSLSGIPVDKSSRTVAKFVGGTESLKDIGQEGMEEEVPGWSDELDSPHSKESFCGHSGEEADNEESGGNGSVGGGVDGGAAETAKNARWLAARFKWWQSIRERSDNGRTRMNWREGMETLDDNVFCD